MRWITEHVRMALLTSNSTPDFNVKFTRCVAPGVIVWIYWRPDAMLDETWTWRKNSLSCSWHATCNIYGFFLEMRDVLPVMESLWRHYMASLWPPFPAAWPLTFSQHQAMSSPLVALFYYSVYCVLLFHFDILLPLTPFISEAEASYMCS